MRIGFTGTRQGMSAAQCAALKGILEDEAMGFTEFHHGDCIGADAEAHDIAATAGVEIVIHPPKEDALRAWKNSPRVLEPRPYLARNREIVRQCDLLIAAPAEDVEQIRSGTWSTVRHARRMGKLVWIIGRRSGDVQKIG
jgi:hypothetical protein